MTEESELVRTLRNHKGLNDLQMWRMQDEAASRIAALEAQLAEARRLILYAADSFAAHAKVSDHPEEQCAYLDSEKMYRNYLSALGATPPAPKVTEADMDDAAVAALVALARHNIPTDIQELLVRGDPMRSIPPGALSKSFAAALKTLTAAQEEEH